MVPALSSADAKPTEKRFSAWVAKEKRLRFGMGFVEDKAGAMSFL